MLKVVPDVHGDITKLHPLGICVYSTAGVDL